MAIFSAIVGTVAQHGNSQSLLQELSFNASLRRGDSDSEDSDGEDDISGNRYSGGLVARGIQASRSRSDSDSEESDVDGDSFGHGTVAQHGNSQSLLQESSFSDSLRRGNSDSEDSDGEGVFSSRSGSGLSDDGSDSDDSGSEIEECPKIIVTEEFEIGGGGMDENWNDPKAFQVALQESILFDHVLIVGHNNTLRLIRMH